MEHVQSQDVDARRRRLNRLLHDSPQFRNQLGKAFEDLKALIAEGLRPRDSSGIPAHKIHEQTEVTMMAHHLLKKGAILS